MTPSAPASNDAVRQYWNTRIHDLEISQHAPGTPGFFADLDEYHFDKLHHLLRLIDFDAQRGKARARRRAAAPAWTRSGSPRSGAVVTAVDIAPAAVELARQNFEFQRLPADVREADGERLPFADASFDFVFAHGVVQYTTNDQALVDECRRVLRPGGVAVFQVYNRISWLNLLSKIMKVGAGAPGRARC